MKHVDALSRNPLPSALMVESEDSLTARIRNAQHADDEVKKLLDAVDHQGVDGYITKGGVLFKGINGDACLVIPKSMQSQIIRRMHESGHFSAVKTEALLKRDYWFPGMRRKVEKVVNNCVECILSERKKGKQEGYLHAIDKGETPLDVMHIDHLGPLPSTKKNYRYILVVVDAFTKFNWLYSTKTINTAEVLDRLRKQSTIFGNPRKIISDRGTSFTSQAFEEYCRQEGIEHVLITTGVPRSNGQVERVNRTLIPLLSKLSAPRPDEWYKYLELAQKFLNATPHRSIGTSPFNLLFGTQMRLKDDPKIKELIETELVELFQTERDELRQQAKENIAKIQQENRRNYNKKRMKATQYKEHDLVSIKRTQFSPGLKFAPKFLGPYAVIRVLRNDRYIVKKVGEHEGPQQTSTSADYMKPWINTNADDHDNDTSSDEDCECRDVEAAPEDSC